MAAYSGPVIDTHHHIWLRKDVTWLADPPIPRMFGDYFGLCRDYPLEEYLEWPCRASETAFAESIS